MRRAVAANNKSVPPAIRDGCVVSGMEAHAGVSRVIGEHRSPRYAACRPGKLEAKIRKFSCLRSRGKEAKLATYTRTGVTRRMNQRRNSPRVEIELPVEIQWKSPAGSPKQALGKTGNISGNGLFIEIPVRLHRETIVKIKVKFPRDVTQVPIELLCQGRVVRCYQRGQIRGMGAVIDDYELRPVLRTGPEGKRPAEATE